MTTSITTTTLPSESIVARADEELLALAQGRLTAEGLLATMQGDLRATQERRITIQDERDALVKAVEQAHSAYEQAHTYARLAQGSPSEASAIAKLAELKKAHKIAGRHLAEFATAHEKEESTLPLREAEIIASIADLHEHLSDVAQKETALRVTREQAWQAFGQETFDALLAIVRTAESEVDRIAGPLVEAQLALSEAREDAEQRLRPWSDLHRQAVQENGIVQDATTRVLSAYLHFLDVLASDGPDMQASIAGYSPSAQVEITQGFVDSIVYRDLGIAKKISDRRVGAQGLIKMYLASR
jgi:hypothetical protein